MDKIKTWAYNCVKQLFYLRARILLKQSVLQVVVYGIHTHTHTHTHTYIHPNMHNLITSLIKQNL